MERTFCRFCELPRSRGARSFFSTDEKLTSDDLDKAQDLYERSADGTTRISQGPIGGNDGFGATFPQALRWTASRVSSPTPEK